LMWRVFALLPALALLSCSTAPRMDPLEAKAAAGDPVAACQFAARNIHNCALEKQKWEHGTIAARPMCLDDPAGAMSETYLDKAVEKVKSDASSRSEVVQLAAPLPLLTSRIRLATSELIVLTSKADKAVELTSDLEQDCAKLANGQPK
jgi:hypothetical protein